MSEPEVRGGTPRVEHGTVSVVIPVRNASAFLATTIRSVLAQTYQPVECIVVDDGSTDDSVAIATAAGPLVQTISTEWRGVSAARNLGIQRARGDFIALLDADDIWTVDKLERQVEAAASTPGTALVLTGYELVADERRLGVVRPSVRGDSILRWLTLEGDGPAFASTALIDRRVLLELGGFDESLSTAADADLAWRLSRSHPMVVVPDVLVRYRIHANQMHRDPVAVADDLPLILDRISSDPATRPGLVRRSRANLAVLLAIRYLRRGELAIGTGHLLRAALLRPDRVLLAPAQGIWRRIRRRLGAQGAAPLWPT